jgi:hypothetical protein
MTIEELAATLAPRLTADAAAWLRDARAKVAADPAAIRTLFPAAGRRCGRAPLTETGEGAEEAAGWTVDDAARTLMISALSGSAIEQEIEDLYRYGDAAEKRGVLRALAVVDPVKKLGAGALPIVRDALRTNDTRLVAAALGPYGARHLDAAAYRQGVLKCVFTGIPLAGIAGLDSRTDDELVRMLRDFADERIAAGRDVPDDVWLVVPRDLAAPPEAPKEA